MSPAFKSLTVDFAVAPQLAPEDMSEVAAAGFKSVIINRPDFEGGPDQPTSDAVMAAARAAGLHAQYQPVVSGAMTPADVAQFSALLEELPGPVLAYCRTGTRCAQLFHRAKGQD